MIAILEDDAERAAEMRAVLAEIVAPTVNIVVHDSALAMNAWLADHVESCWFVSLDHDLGPSRAGIDPGIGRHVVDFLATRRASCPVVVHSSNGTAATGMAMALRAGGWRVLRVVPFGVHKWVRAVWAPAVRDALRFHRRTIVAPHEDTRAMTVTIGFVGPGMSGCHTSFEYVLRACAGIERVPFTSGDCEYLKDGRRFRLELLICSQRSIASLRGPAPVEELARVDGIIFVVESQEFFLERNKDHLQVVREDLKPYGVDLDEVAVVFALNKADLDGAPPPANLASVDALTSALSTRRCAHVVTSAKTGRGTMESIDTLIDMLMLC